MYAQNVDSVPVLCLVFLDQVLTTLLGAEVGLDPGNLALATGLLVDLLLRLLSILLFRRKVR